MVKDMTHMEDYKEKIIEKIRNMDLKDYSIKRNLVAYTELGAVVYGDGDSETITLVLKKPEPAHMDYIHHCASTTVMILLEDKFRGKKVKISVDEVVE
jgi:hypothetical protein